MKTTRILAIGTMALMLGTGSVFAQQSDEQKGNCPQRPERPQPTEEEMLEMRTQQLQRELMLDDATAAKFAPLYAEYLAAMKEVMPQQSKGPESGKEAKPGEGKPEKKAEPTDAEIKEMIAKRIQTQRDIADVQEKYLSKFSDILSARQLQKVFAPQGGPRHGGMGPGRPGAGKPGEGGPGAGKPGEGGKGPQFGGHHGQPGCPGGQPGQPQNHDNEAQPIEQGEI